MLGEDHSLLNDFPEHEKAINALSKSDQTFVQENKLYTRLDKEIRKLELRNEPIDDLEMQRLKLERAQLKDALYSRLKDY